MAEMAEMMIKVVLEIKNKGIEDEMRAIISSVEGFQICHSNKFAGSADAGFYDLLVLEIGDDFNADLNFANTLQSSGSVKDIFLISALANPEILVGALRLEVKGFFTPPVKKEEVITALLKIKKQWEMARERMEVETTKRGKIINVFGCKGGIGTTTIAVNLAISLAGLEGTPAVALIDLNQSYGEILHVLNLKSVSDWVQVVKNISRVDKMYLMSALARHPSGIYVLPSPDIDKTEGVINIQSLGILLKFMQTLFDFVVLDSGPRMDEYSNTALKVSNLVFLVSCVSVPCIVNLKKILNIFLEKGYPRIENIEIIVNRYVKDDIISLKEIEAVLYDKKVLCCIPNIYAITMHAINSGIPLCMTEKGTKISGKFKELALACVGQKGKEKKEGKGKGFSISSLKIFT